MNAVAFADDTSQILFSGGDDGLVRVWDRRTLDDSKAKPVGILTGHTDGVTFVDSKVSHGNGCTCLTLGVRTKRLFANNKVGSIAGYV